MDLAALEVLVAVSEERGFSRAAERLGRTQPAVSQAVRRLEEEVGARLVDRSSKDATLTPAGTLLCGHARQLLNLRRQAEAALQDLRRLRRGRVAIAANEYTVIHLFPILAAFRRRHPDVEVEVRRSPASEIPSEVLGRDVELGILTYRPVEPGLAAVQIASDELALVVAPDHPLAGRKQVPIRRLAEESFLAHNVRSPYRERVIRAFERHRTPLRIVMELPSLDAIKRLAAEGLGVALVPRRAAEGEVARGELAALTVPALAVASRAAELREPVPERRHAGHAHVRAQRAGLVGLEQPRRRRVRVTPIGHANEDAVRREQTQHTVERVGVETRVRRDLGRCGTRVADGVGGAALGDHVQAARRDVRAREVGDERRGILEGRGVRIAPTHGLLARGPP